MSTENTAGKPEQPVLSFQSGLTAFSLIHELPSIAQQYVDWCLANQYRPPEVARCSVPAYKLALVHELIQTARVATHDFARELIGKNGDVFDTSNYGQACHEVAELIKSLDV